ncbi:MAG: terminase, partial [Candidatus Gracilibacteria bacterium]|nr:terminase [Candidatus Gracilibacteria bacterium]
MPRKKEIEKLKELLSDKEWRLFSGKLYYIKDKYGKRIPFKPNKAQTYYYKNRHKKNIILKARQLGFSTFIDIDKLDDFLFSSYSNYGVIAQDLNAANSIFNEKIKFGFDNIPDWLKVNFKLKNDRKGELTCESNGNAISVDTSFRSATLQGLHISEFGKICTKYPEKARE